jgi:hypothetical protein
VSVGRHRRTPQQHEVMRSAARATRRRRSPRRDVLYYAVVGSFVMFVGGVFVLYGALDTSSTTTTTYTTPTVLSGVLGGSSGNGEVPGSTPDAGALPSAAWVRTRAVHQSVALFVVRGHREMARMVRTGGRRFGASGDASENDAATVATNTANVGGAEPVGAVLVTNSSSSSGSTSSGALSASSWDVSERGGGGDGNDGGAPGDQGAGFDPAALLLGGSGGGGGASISSSSSNSFNNVAAVVVKRSRLVSTLLPKPQILYLFGIPRSKHDALPLPGGAPVQAERS